MKNTLWSLIFIFASSTSFAATECWNVNRDNNQVRNFIYNIDKRPGSIHLTTPVNTTAGILMPKEFEVSLNNSSQGYELVSPIELNKNGIITTANLLLIAPKSSQESTLVFILKDSKIYYFESFFCKDIQESQD